MSRNPNEVQNNIPREYKGNFSFDERHEVILVFVERGRNEVKDAFWVRDYDGRGPMYIQNEEQSLIYGPRLRRKYWWEPVFEREIKLRKKGPRANRGVRIDLRIIGIKSDGVLGFELGYIVPKWEFTALEDELSGRGGNEW